MNHEFVGTDIGMIKLMSKLWWCQIPGTCVGMFVRRAVVLINGNVAVTSSPVLSRTSSRMRYVIGTTEKYWLSMRIKRNCMDDISMWMLQNVMYAPGTCDIVIYWGTVILSKAVPTNCFSTPVEQIKQYQAEGL